MVSRLNGPSVSVQRLMAAILNLLIFKTEFKPVLVCLHKQSCPSQRSEILLVFKHEHSKFIQKFIIDRIEDITTALTAVSAAENIIDELQFVFKFKIDPVFVGNGFL